MSFEFEWPRYFSASFYDSAKASLEQALNSGQKLSLVADKIRVVDLNLGSIPPELDLLAIDELSAVDGSFKGRFMLSYSGDALISLATNLHVNPLTQYKHALEMLATPSVLLTTAEMFVQLTLSHLRLRCVISLSFSKTSGLAMTFRDDPLESLNVSSSFDSFGVVQQFIQSEIENQLRERFRRDLPSLIHRLSQRWCADMAQQAVATNNQTPIVVEQIIHTPVSETGPVGREPDDSLPYDFAGNPAHMRPRAASRSFDTSPSKSYLGDRDSNNIDDEAIQFDSDSDSSERYDESAQERSNVSFPNRSGRSFFDETRLSQDYQDMSVYPDENKSRSSSWSSTWSRESTADGLSPPRPSPPGSGSQHRLDRKSGTDSPIISSLKRSTSNFATTFSKAPVPVSVQDLRKSLNGSERHLQQERQTGMRRRSHNSQRNGTSFQADSNASKQDVSETRMPLATRKRLHRLEGTTPKATPNNSPHKSRILKGAKSRDRLRIHRKDLDEYFPVTDEGSSTTTAMNDNVFTSSRSARPSLLNPDVPMQIPMAASLMHSSKSDFPSKNSLRRTIMSSRLRDLERVSGSGPSSSRRPPADHNFFTSNSYS